LALADDAAMNDRWRLCDGLRQPWRDVAWKRCRSGTQPGLALALRDVV